MHPLAAPGTLWVLSSDGKYLVRPQADETSHKKQVSCGRQGKRAYPTFPVSQKVSPLRRRPKGFPIALWKPSAPLLRMEISTRNKMFPCFSRFAGFRLCGGDQRAFPSPPGPIWGEPLFASEGSYFASCAQNNFSISPKEKKRRLRISRLRNRLCFLFPMHFTCPGTALCSGSQ